MNLKNITLKTAELGPVNWEDVEKLQPSADGFIFFVNYDTITKCSVDNGNEECLLGYYIQTDFTHKPTYKEVINYIIEKEYPLGKENQILRLGIYNQNNKDYLDYYNHVEDIIYVVKRLLNNG